MRSAAARFAFALLVATGCGGGAADDAHGQAGAGYGATGASGGEATAASASTSTSTSTSTSMSTAGVGGETGAVGTGQGGEPSGPLGPSGPQGQEPNGSGLLGPTERFPIVPMRLSPTPMAQGPDAQIDLELRADGGLYSHGQLVGQLAGDRVVSPQGREILAVAPDGAVSLSGTPTRIRLLDSGEVAMPNGATLSFTDDGAPMAAMPGQPPRRGPLQLTGLRPEARRTAALLAILVATVALPH